MARFWTRLWPLVCLGLACSPKTSTSLTDVAAVQQDIGDVSTVADAVPIVDVPGPQLDAADVADNPEEPEIADAIAADAVEAEGDDVNYMPDLGACGWKDLVITSDSAPSGSSCTPSCPTGYPCTCGDCPWVQTPPMKQPRMGATAVWTGTEVVVFGGSKEAFLGGQVYTWSAERWNPKAGKGFEYVSIPKIDAPFDKLLTYWDGSKVWVVTQRLEKGGTDHSFVWDPATNQATPLKWKNRPYSLWSSLKVWVGGRILEWGYRTLPGNEGKMPYFIPSKDDFEVSLYDPATDTWQPQQLPPIKGEPELPTLGCAVASGDDVFFFAPPDEHIESAETTRVYRFGVSDAAWQELPPLPVDPGRQACHERGFVHGEPGGFIAWGMRIYPGVAGKAGPVVGIRYRKAEMSWVILPTLPGAVPAGTNWASVYISENVFVHSLFFKPGNLPMLPTYYHLGLESGSWQPLTSVGFPKDQRNLGAVVVTDTDFTYLGGVDGPGFTVVHADGVRIPLTALGVGQQ